MPWRRWPPGQPPHEEGRPISRTTHENLYWRKIDLFSKEVPCKMLEVPKRPLGDTADLEVRVAELEDQVRKLGLKKVILEGTIELLGKDPDANPNWLTNREKTLLIQALRPELTLGILLVEVELALSSYQHQVESLSKPDRDAILRIHVAEIFHESDARYGYRHIHLELRKEETAVSERWLVQS